MADRAEKLLAAARAAEALRASEAETDRLRAEFNAAVIAAHKAGVSYAELGRVSGLTRQRIYRIVEGL
jgi:hypothetical protein